jgi:hypothetical protein
MKFNNDLEKELYKLVEKIYRKAEESEINYLSICILPEERYINFNGGKKVNDMVDFNTHEMRKKKQKRKVVQNET